MSTNNRIRVMIGLCVLGSFGWATVRDHADADEPRDANAPTAAASTPPERYLMLANGHVIKGVVSQNEKEFLVRQRIGTMQFPRQQVAGAFNTLRDAYEYQVQQLPDRDSEERLKLARWCLNVKLHAEAKEQLEKVLELNSKNPLARAMLVTMEQSAAMAAERRRDPEVRQTGAMETADNNPIALDSLVIEKAQRRLSITGVPVIFDLPTPLAIRRTHEFITLVNPLLQAYCVRCHDGNYEGPFQLVPTKTRGEQTEDAKRVNLDATLRLVDRENLAKSELLTATLRPHGNGPRKRPIFPGSNDRAYQILSTWVQSLRSPKDIREAARVQSGRAQADDGETFAAGRGRTGNENQDDDLTSVSSGGRAPLAGAPMSARIPRPTPFPGAAGPKPEGTTPAAPDDFPLPFAMTGVRPNLASPKAAIGPGSRSSRSIDPVSPPQPGVAGAPEPGSPADAAKAGDPSAATKKKAKPVTIDPAILERALQLRNGSQ
jgi:hypothetical protein